MARNLKKEEIIVTVFNTQKLRNAFSLVAPFSKPRSPKEVLQYAKLTSIGGVTSLTATDCESGAEVVVDCESPSSNGSLLLPIGKMIDILREVSGEEVEISSTKTAIFVKCEASTFRLGFMNPDEFPTLPGSPKVMLQMDSQILRGAINMVSKACDESGGRYATAGVFFDFDDGKIILVGTDGSRLHSSFVGNHSENLSSLGQVIIPSEAVKSISRALLNIEGSISFSSDQNCCHFTSNGMAIFSRRLEGLYPRWRDCKPANQPDKTLRIQCGKFLSSVRQAAIASDKESRGIGLSIGNALLTVSSTTEANASEIEVPTSYEGEDCDLRVKHNYLTEFFGLVDQDSFVTLSFSDSEGPLSATYENHSCLIMPLSK